MGSSSDNVMWPSRAGGNVAKRLLKCYLIMLICTATITVVFYVVAAYSASRIDSVVEENWDNPDFQEQKANTIMRNMTKEVRRCGVLQLGRWPHSIAPLFRNSRM